LRSILYSKRCIILPRQARDKHIGKENSKKRDAFLIIDTRYCRRCQKFRQ
jgi:hypothetical protein